MNELFDEHGQPALIVVAPDPWIFTDSELADVIESWQKNIGDTP